MFVSHNELTLIIILLSHMATDNMLSRLFGRLYGFTHHIKMYQVDLSMETSDKDMPEKTTIKKVNKKKFNWKNDCN